MQSIYSSSNENAVPPNKVLWLKLQMEKENSTQSASNVVKISSQFQGPLQNKLITAQCPPVYMLLLITQ